MDTRKQRLNIIHEQMGDAVTLLLSSPKAREKAEAIIMALAMDERAIRKEKPSSWLSWRRKKRRQPRSMTKLM